MPSVGLNDYQRFTDRSNRVELAGIEGARFACLGLFGEVGSLLSVAKKKRRDDNAFPTYRDDLIEELGDSLWYFANSSLRVGLLLSEIAAQAEALDDRAGNQPLTFTELRRFSVTNPDTAALEKRLLGLGAAVGRVVGSVADAAAPQDEVAGLFARALRDLIDVAALAGIDLDEAASRNIDKVNGRWPAEKVYGDLFDEGYDEQERLPRTMSMIFRERTVGGKQYVTQTWNGVNIGDRVTDNRSQADDYRFHDVFHLAFAAVLGWSPVLRALLRLKRKSNPEVDENQDGARAIVIEEAIAAWIFNHGAAHDNYTTDDALDYSVLKAVRTLVERYEVESRPMWQWADAILSAFRVFQRLQDERCGTVRVDLTRRSIEFISEGVSNLG